MEMEIKFKIETEIGIGIGMHSLNEVYEKLRKHVFHFTFCTVWFRRFLARRHSARIP